MTHGCDTPSLISRLMERPLDLAAALTAVAAMGAIVVNALYLQPGAHPAPIFPVRNVLKPAQPGVVAPPAPRPRPAELGGRTMSASAARPELVVEIQRELQRRGFYDGMLDGVLGSKTDAAIRDFEQAAGLKASGEASDELLRRLAKSNVKAAPRPPGIGAGRPDPLGDLIAPPAKRVMAVQRVLSDFGYAQLRPTGVMNPETSSAIEKFERERKLPVTGMISDRLVRELAATTGRPLE